LIVDCCLDGVEGIEGDGAEEGGEPGVAASVE